MERKARARHTIILDHIPMVIGIIAKYGLHYYPRKDGEPLADLFIGTKTTN